MYVYIYIYIHTYMSYVMIYMHACMNFYDLNNVRTDRRNEQRHKRYLGAF